MKERGYALPIDRDIPDLIENEQVRLGQELEFLVEPVVSQRLAKTGEQPHGRGEQHAAVLLTGVHPQRHGQMRLAHARRAEQQHVFAVLPVAASREFPDHFGVDRRLKRKLKTLQRLLERKPGHGQPHGQVLGPLGLHFSTEEVFDKITLRPVLLGRVFPQGRELRGHLIQPELMNSRRAGVRVEAYSCTTS